MPRFQVNVLLNSEDAINSQSGWINGPTTLLKDGRKNVAVPPDPTDCPKVSEDGFTHTKSQILPNPRKTFPLSFSSLNWS